MICSNCNKRIKKTLIKCPYCGKRVITGESFDLPQLKEEIDEEQIIELSPIDYNLSDNPYEVELKDDNNDSEDFDKFEGIDDEPKVDEDLLLGETKQIVIEEESSLMDDISMQIENMSSEESLTEEDKVDSEDELEENSSVELIDETENNDRIETIDSDESIKKRKKIFIISIVSLLFLLAAGIIIFNFWVKSDSNNRAYQSEEVSKIERELKDALDEYYEDSDTDRIKEIFAGIKDSEEEIEKAQNIVKEKCEEWVTTYYEKEFEDKKEIEEYRDKIKKLIQDIHTYVVIKIDEKRILAISDTDFKTLVDKVNKIYDDSILYFDALNYVGKKDYNKAYATFDKIDSDNRYYSKANEGKKNIEKAILDLLNKDIDKMSKNIEELEDKALLSRYIQIQEIIFEYKNVYHSINLSDNVEYKELLELYSNKVEDLSQQKEEKKENEPVQNEINDNSNLEETEENE